MSDFDAAFSAYLDDMIQEMYRLCAITQAASPTPTQTWHVGDIARFVRGGPTRMRVTKVYPNGNLDLVDVSHGGTYTNRDPVDYERDTIAQACTPGNQPPTQPNKFGLGDVVQGRYTQELFEVLAIDPCGYISVRRLKDNLSVPRPHDPSLYTFWCGPPKHLAGINRTAYLFNPGYGVLPNGRPHTFTPQPLLRVVLVDLINDTMNLEEAGPSGWNTAPQWTNVNCSDFVLYTPPSLVAQATSSRAAVIAAMTDIQMTEEKAHPVYIPAAAEICTCSINHLMAFGHLQGCPEKTDKKWGLR
jgi:hypothetical protein